VTWLLLVAQSNSGVAAAEATADSGSTSRATDVTDEESVSSRRHKHCKHKVELASSLSTGVPPLPRKPNNPYSLYFMLRKKVRRCFHCSWQESQYTITKLVSRKRHSVFSLYVCLCVHPCVILYWQFVITVSYKPLAGISRNWHL